MLWSSVLFLVHLTLVMMIDAGVARLCYRCIIDSNIFVLMVVDERISGVSGANTTQTTSNQAIAVPYPLI